MAMNIKAPLSLFLLPALVIITAAASCLPACAYYAEYLPAGIWKQRKRVPQKVVTLDFGHDWSAQVSGVTLKNIEGKFTASGVDKSGRPWSLSESEDRGWGGSCYRADLDKNGVEDILVHFPNASNGYPFSTLVIFFVDKDGVAHREEVVSRFSAEKTGIADLIETKDGTMVLVQDLAYGRQGKRELGYWRFSALRAQQCHLVEAPSMCAVPLPAYVFFTIKPNHLLSSNATLLEQHYKHKN
mgnify:CR=1 FL=1